MKKVISFTIVICLLSTLFFVGCTQQKSESSTATSVETSSAPTVTGISGKLTVLLSNWPEKDGINPTNRRKLTGYASTIDEFKSLYPAVELNVISVPTADFNTKAATMLAAKSVDVVDMFTNNSEYAEDLAPWIEKDKADLTDLIAAPFKKWVDWDQSIITCLPLKSKVFAIYYDKQIFDEWGVEYLKSPTTYAEIMEKAKQLTGINPVSKKQNYGIWAALTGDAQDVIHNYLSRVKIPAVCFDITGPKLYDVTPKYDTDTAWADALNFYKDAIPYLQPGAKECTGYEVFGTNENDSAIMLMGWTDGFIAQAEAAGNAGDLRKVNRIGFADVPRNPDGKFFTFYGGSMGMGFSKNSQFKEAAWAFVKWSATSPAVSQYLYQNLGYIPVNSKGSQLCQFAEKYPDIVEIMNKQSKDFTQTYAFIDGSYSIMDKYATEYWIGKKDLKAATEAMQKEVVTLVNNAKAAGK